ncbi:hypothetical protein [Bacillus sp. CHD6a]|uniref:hypothetical protein n=1 Tax=Bacillus sp. CHD6a TaxID=1643452 RepID=UPI000A691E5F|nr:hypothetical protein [Bacillus sp. CHD6a]
MEWLWLPLIVAISLMYYAHKNSLKHKEKLREIDLKEKQIELEMIKEKNGTTTDN